MALTVAVDTSSFRCLANRAKTASVSTKRSSYDVVNTLGWRRQVALVIILALALACLVSPVASLVAMSLDPERRAPHDRLANTVVVHLEQP